MGTEVVSRCVKAPSGTWLLGYRSDEAEAPAFRDELEEAPAAALVALEPAATDALEGPKPAVLVEPPATSPVAPVVDAELERIKRLRRSAGFDWNPGFSSRTT